MPQFLAKLNTLPEETNEDSMNFPETHLPVQRKKQKPNKTSASTSFAEESSSNEESFTRSRVRAPAQCPFCKKTFSKKANLKAHIANIHEGKRPFQCDICFETFAQKAHLQRHMSSTKCIASVQEGIKKPFKCDICFDTFARKTHLKKHLASNKHK